MNEQRYAALRKAQQDGIEAAFMMNLAPVCPHCGRKNGFGTGGIKLDVLDPGVHQVECAHCSESFTVKTVMIQAFSTNFIPKDEQGGPAA